MLSSKYALDVSALFAETVALYTNFAQDIQQLIHDIHSCTPQQLADRCGMLVDSKKILTTFDQQIIDILEVTGRDIAEEPMIHDYRIALAHATHASSNLHQQLQAQKIIIQTNFLNSSL